MHIQIYIYSNPDHIFKTDILPEMAGNLFNCIVIGDRSLQ